MKTRKQLSVKAMLASAVSILACQMFAPHASANLLVDGNFAPGVAGSPDASTGDVPMSDGGPWIGWNNWVAPYSGYYVSSNADGPVPSPLNGGSLQSGKTFSGSVAGIYQYVPVTAGETYVGSALFENATAVNGGGDTLNGAETDTIILAFFSGPNGTGSDLGAYQSATSVNASSPANVWLPVSETAMAPIGAESVQFLAFFSNPDYAGGALYVEDADLEVPEPATIGLLVVAGVPMLMRRRRRA